MFQPLVPATGLTGWNFLQRTYNDQIKSYAASAQNVRLTDYFAENISNVTSAQDLVSDRRLLEVSLGAFGLQDDIDNRFFIKTMLEEGSTNDDALANRFSDRRYSEFVKAFGLGPGENSQLENSDFPNQIIEKYLASSFEVATGQQDDSLRVALYAQRTLAELANPAEKSAQRLATEEVAEAVNSYGLSISEESDYFESNIAKVTSVEDLLADDVLLKFALGAFGLQEDYEAIASFVATDEQPESDVLAKIEAVLKEGSVADIAMANQLKNPAYAELSRAFGFGIAEDLQTGRFDFSQMITDRFIEQTFVVPETLDFEGAVVVSDGQFQLERFTVTDMSNDAKWFTIMGEPPLRAMFERAFNLPAQFGQVDIEQQLTVFKQRARATFGTDEISQLADKQNLDDLISRYIIRSQVDTFAASTSPASVALALLQS